MAIAAVAPAMPCMGQAAVRLDSDAKLILSDNPFLIGGDRRGAAAVEVAARPEILWSLAPATSLEMAANVAHRQYLRRYGGFFNGRAHLLARHRDSEYLSFDTRLAYARELPADALTEGADFSIDSVAVRESYSARASMNWHPDARTSVTTAAGWERLRYPDSILLAPTWALSGEMGISRRLSEATSLGLQAGATRTESTGNPTLSAKSLRVTVAHRLGPSLTADGQLGVEWSGVGVAGNSERARLAGSAGLCYRPSLTEACLSASLQSEVSGLGGPQRESFLGAEPRRQLSERSSLVATADYRSTEMGLGARATTALRISGSYERRLAPRLSVMAGAGYLRREFLTGERAGAMVLQIGIAFRGRRR